MNFDILPRDIQVEYSKHLNKKERNLIKTLSIKDKNVTLPFKKFLKSLDFETQEEGIKFLNSFMNKYIILSSENSKLLSYLSILQSFYISGDDITLIFPDEIASSFKKGTNYEKLGINKVLTFKEKFSYRLYQHVKKSSESSVYIPMETLRHLLEIKDSYKRYYDIEKNLLIPVLKDLEDNGHLPLLYTKNKSGDYKSAKILGITLEKQIVENDNTAIINDIMIKIGKEVKNFTETYSIILKALAEHGEEYVRKNTDYALKNFTGNFDIYLEQLLLKNTPVEKAYLTVKKKFKTLFELHMEVLKIAQKESQYPSNLKFLIKIYSLKDGESTVCDGKDISMKITYNKNDLSLIEVFRQKIKDDDLRGDKL